MGAIPVIETTYCHEISCSVPLGGTEFEVLHVLLGCSTHAALRNMLSFRQVLPLMRRVFFEMRFQLFRTASYLAYFLLRALMNNKQLLRDT